MTSGPRRGSRRRAPVLPVVLLLLTAAVVAAAVLVLRAPALRPAVDAVPAVRGAVAVVVGASGRVAPAESLGLSFAAPAGVVARVAVGPGAPVHAGDVLAALDDTVPRARLAATTARAAADRADLDAARTRAPLDPLAVARLEAAVAADGADGAAAHEDLDATVLRAPRSGTVTEVGAAAGTRVVAPGTVVVRLADLSVPVLALEVAAADVPRVAVGQRASAAVEGVDGRVAGVVDTLTPVPGPGGRYVATVRPGLPPPTLRVGQAADARVVVARADDVVVVPRAAVAASPTGPTVVVRRDGVDRVTAVGVGLVDDTRAQILRGIVPGDLVVLEHPSGRPLDPLDPATWPGVAR